jgi:hypothetical protein
MRLEDVPFADVLAFGDLLRLGDRAHCPAVRHIARFVPGVMPAD